MQDLLLMIVLLGSLAGSNAFLPVPLQKHNQQSLIAHEVALSLKSPEQTLAMPFSLRNKAVVKRSDRVFALAMARKEAGATPDSSKGFTPSKESKRDESEDEEDDDEEDDYDEEEIDLSAEYEALAKKEGGKLTVFALAKWKELKELIEEGLLTKQDIYEIAGDVLDREEEKTITDKEAKTLVLDKDQFISVIEAIDEFTEGDDYEDEEEDEEGDEYDEEREAEIRKDREDLWKRLLKNPTDDKVKVADLKNDEEIQELFQDGTLTNESWKELIQLVVGEKANVNTAKITFEEFDEIVDQIAGVLDHEEGEYDDDEYEEEDEEDYEEDEGEVVDTVAKEVPKKTATKTPPPPPITNNRRPPSKSSK